MLTSDFQKPTFQEKVIASHELAVTWLTSNVRDNGLFYYIYNPKTHIYPNKNNALRQLMGSRVLAELASEDEQYLELHQRNLDFVMEHWYEENDNIGYVYYSDKSKLGANAMLLRTLVYSPMFDDYADEAKKVADGIVSLVGEDNLFRPWIIEPDYGYDSDYLLTFYSGEALLALVEYFEKTRDEAYLEVVQRVQDAYIVRYVDQMEAYYYPAYVPWHTLALNHIYFITQDEKYADALFAMNDKLLELLDETQYIGRFYNPDTPEYGNPHAASDAVYTEGLAYAIEVAQEVGDRKREKQYTHALMLAVDNLISLQYQEEVKRVEHDAWRLLGAFRYRINNGQIRIDTTQHAYDAYTKILSLNLE